MIRGYHYTWLPTGLEPTPKCNNTNKENNMKRKLFSKKDGTPFMQDLHDITEEVKLFFHALPPKIKQWISEATDIVDALEKLDQALKDGQPADVAIDYVLGLIKGDLQEEVYEAIKDALNNLIITFELSDQDKGTDKLTIASEAILQISELSRLEADTTAQLAVFFYKS